MEWLDKIPKWIQIPLKILLPALCIFSGFLLIISDSFADKLYLKEFREETGFAFGLIFAITLSLILVYMFSFLVNWIIKKYKEYKINQQILYDIENADNFEKIIFFGLYNAPSNMQMLNGNNPIVGNMVNKGYIFSTQQSCKLNRYTNFLEIVYSLSPRVKEVIKKLFVDIEKEIKSLKKRQKKETNSEKIELLKKDIKQAEATIQKMRKIKFEEEVYYG